MCLVRPLQRTATCTTQGVSGSGGFRYGRHVGLVSDDKSAEFSLARFALGTIYGMWDDVSDQRPSAHA